MLVQHMGMFVATKLQSTELDQIQKTQRSSKDSGEIILMYSDRTILKPSFPGKQGLLWGQFKGSFKHDNYLNS
jgi:hypothetical protein